jgi:hypothetical protein
VLRCFRFSLTYSFADLLSFRSNDSLVAIEDYDRQESGRVACRMMMAISRKRSLKFVQSHQSVLRTTMIHSVTVTRERSGMTSRFSRRSPSAVAHNTNPPPPSLLATQHTAHHSKGNSHI